MYFSDEVVRKQTVGAWVSHPSSDQTGANETDRSFCHRSLSRQLQNDMLYCRTQGTWCLLRRACPPGLRRKGKGEVKKVQELVDIGPIVNRLHTSLCFDVAGEIKKGWNREPKEREEKEQRDEERKTPKSSTSQFQREQEREVRRP